MVIQNTTNEFSNIFLYNVTKDSTLCALPAVAEKGRSAHGTASACIQVVLRYTVVHAAKAT
jgi:hypothetical protein